LYLAIRRLTVIVLTLVLLLLTPAAALAATYYERLEPYVSQYNDNLDQIPRMARWPFANERINLTITGGDGPEIIGVVTSRGEAQITSFQPEGLETPTLLVEVDGAALTAVLDAPSRDGALALVRSAKVQGVGFFRVLKAAIFRLAARFIK